MPLAPAKGLLALTPEEREPLSISVARRLREVIVAGHVAVGEEIPSEKELCRQFGVGRSTIREALRILQAQGLVSGGDTVSTARPRVSFHQSLASATHTMVNALRLGQVPLLDLVELRIVIEGAIVEEAAQAKPAALDPARVALAQMQQRDLDIEQFRTADLAFHRSLAVASGNAAYGLVMNVLRDAISSHLGEALHRTPNPTKAMAALRREHEDILDAVSRGHGKRARQLVTDHIRDFYRETTS